MKIHSLLTSRRFWVAVGGVLVVVAQQYGLPLTDAAVTKIVGLLMAWIGSDTFRRTE